MGWDHTFSYKGFSLYFLLDWRYGGKVLSQTQAEIDLYGVSEITADARDRGYVMLEGQQIDNVKGFYKNVVGGRAGVTEYYMYDATNLRLREVSLSYNFSKKWIQKTKVLKDVQLSFVTAIYVSYIRKLLLIRIWYFPLGMITKGLKYSECLQPVVWALL